MRAQRAEDVILMRAQRAEDLLLCGVNHEQVLRFSSLALEEASG